MIRSDREKPRRQAYHPAFAASFAQASRIEAATRPTLRRRAEASIAPVG